MTGPRRCHARRCTVEGLNHRITEGHTADERAVFDETWATSPYVGASRATTERRSEVGHAVGGSSNHTDSR